MTHIQFIEKLLPLQMELSLAIAKEDLDNIEYYSIRIGKLIHRYLDSRKLLVKK